MKFRLWEGQLKRCNYAQFPTLSASQPIEATTYVAFVGQLREQFKTWFADLRANNQAFALFATTFAVNVNRVAVHLQMELIDLQCNTDLKTKFTEVARVKFCQQYVPVDQVPGLMRHARMIIALFRSTYLCEQLKWFLNNTRNKIIDAHLKGTLRLASTHLQPDIQGLVKQAQHQTAHWIETKIKRYI